VIELSVGSNGAGAIGDATARPCRAARRSRPFANPATPWRAGPRTVDRGLPRVTKPANYAGFITFAIELFDALDARGWPRLPTSVVPPSRQRCTVESFPTSAWRSLGLPPLPGKASARLQTVPVKLSELRAAFPLDAPDGLSHDELQALVSGLAGIALEDGNDAGVTIVGVPPMELEGTWREGFIVNPTPNVAATRQ
jgi:hypothetical protein